MYAMVRKYAGKGNMMDRLAPRVRDGLVPLLRQAPGFRSYHAFASEDGHVVSVSAIDDRPTADAANAKVREWVGANLRDALPDPPEVLAGEVRRQLPGQARGGADMFAAVRVWEGVGPRNEVLPMVREHVFPVITGAPGFRGYYTFLDEREASRGVSASLFDSREHAMAAQEQVVAAMRDRRITPNLPRVMAGQTAIVAAAEG